ncbi:MAG: ATP-binding protein [Candidatus Omnitrophica bacterium]|nr:ATP-binding protein [Candidatus Omnitrophota bacterium]
MNENHSRQKLVFKPRWILSALLPVIKENPVVVLTGARQVGKSTLLMNDPAFSSWKYVNLDDYNLLAQAEAEPASLWKDSDKIIFDEVQKAPKLLSAIKQTVDKDRAAKKFILSGSANLLLMSKVVESLAGRAVYFPLFPMAIGEMQSHPQPRIFADILNGNLPKPRVLPQTQEPPYQIMAKGCMPALLTQNKNELYLRWWEGYIATYLERDLRQLSQIESLPEFRRLMEAVALRSGQIMNQTEISRDTGISQATVYRYLNLLETTCLMQRIPAYAHNRTKRLIKSPKVYFIDPGLTSFLCGYFNAESLKQAKEAGNIFESLVLLHLKIMSELTVPQAKIFYWRTVSGKEVDFVIEHGKEIIAIEVKLSGEAEYKHIQGLSAFLKDYPGATAGIVIYTGNEIKYLGEKIIAVPWRMFTGEEK